LGRDVRLYPASRWSGKVVMNMTERVRIEGVSSDSSVCVFAPSLYLTVTIEERDGCPEAGEVHLHPGGQGFWIACMLAELGAVRFSAGRSGARRGRPGGDRAHLGSPFSTGADEERVPVPGHRPAGW
jgi:hypothetical protein